MSKAKQNPTLTNVDIINAKVIGYQGLQRLLVDQAGIIQQIQPMGAISPRLPDSSLQILDVAEDWISLGGVDLQINGALGLAFPDLNPTNAHNLHNISEYLWDLGVDGYLPTLVTTSIENIQRSLAVIANYTGATGAKILGVHLESSIFKLS